MATRRKRILKPKPFKRILDDWAQAITFSNGGGRAVELEFHGYVSAATCRSLAKWLVRAADWIEDPR